MRRRKRRGTQLRVGASAGTSVAVVRSSETHINNYSEVFSRAELVHTLKFYKTRNAKEETTLRSRTILADKKGFPLECLEKVAPPGFGDVHNPMATEPWMTGDLPSE
ncbi:hypothetical protein BDV26DRAFT_148842 [Aspergillus bertholletiae]|uniref:Uncharacterized protein n=1 Tax=Aspergillus bertholletiae TaxID=1226010 RepID=A0A5N7BEE5_9EURO|nr:hypothetical protein BDV26DRAFT_148842 [Aspergillus bertholletiae]